MQTPNGSNNNPPAPRNLPTQYAHSVDEFVVMFWHDREKDQWNFHIISFKLRGFRAPFTLERGSAITNWEAEDIADRLIQWHSDGESRLPRTPYYGA